ncbi:GntR family histidine utilization transcriptional repressor [Pseudomonas duriflava]|uniref:Histidine utilization repressor n=1 Tax=Pseudomonas duriflava TaxID=459528 RepID=A0A562QFS0_9PSED|nr:histidine utilization repressor [Pseudomonas duriflava]TWI55595.1 GntR family histidine utilization transcriptional repressor [Pseudomonas duriflava]
MSIKPAYLPEGLEAAPAPLYTRVKHTIVQQIQNGNWPPHHKIPSESELVAELGVSRMTVHRALRELTADGVLVRMQGVGTFVAEPKGQAALFEVHSIAEEIASRGHRHRTEVKVLRSEAASPEQAALLNVREGQSVFHSILVHYENDVPVQIEDRYVNATLAPDYLAQDFTQLTPHDYLSQAAPLSEGEHVVEAILATAQECEWLDIERNEPCLLMRRRTWSGRQTVTSARLIYPGSRYRLEGRFGS